MLYLPFLFHSQGLFRLAAAATVVKQLKKSLDYGDVDHSKFAADPHAVAGQRSGWQFEHGKFQQN